MLATDLLMEKHPKGLVLRGEPTALFVAPPVYLHEACMLYEALKGNGELTPALSVVRVGSSSGVIRRLPARQADGRVRVAGLSFCSCRLIRAVGPRGRQG